MPSRPLRFRFAGFVTAFSILAGFAASAAAEPRFLASSLRYRTGIFPNGSAVADFDNDGKLDYVFAVDVSGSSLQVGGGRGDGTFFVVQNIAASVRGAPVAADLDGDGIPDLAQAGPALVVRFGASGSGLGGEVVLAPASESFTPGVAVADVNGDGRLDLISGHGDVVTLLGIGPGSFGPEIASPVGLSGENAAVYYNIVAGDLDEDGRPDLLIVATSNAHPSGFIGWMRGNGDGTFGVSTFLEEESYLVSLADLNGDGHLDVVTPEECCPETVRERSALRSRSPISTWTASPTSPGTACPI